MAKMNVTSVSLVRLLESVLQLVRSLHMIPVDCLEADRLHRKSNQIV